MSDYLELFGILSTTTPRKHLTNFIEIFAVISGARQTSLVALTPEQVEPIRKLLRPHGVYAVNYRGSSNYIIVSSRYKNSEKIRFLQESTTLTSNVHKVTGEVLGYLTPYNIVHPPEGGKKNVSLILNVLYNEKDYEVQIAPQKVLDKRNDDIQIYFGRIANKLAQLNKLDLPFTIISMETKIEISKENNGSGGRSGGTRKYSAFIK